MYECIVEGGCNLGVMSDFDLIEIKLDTKIGFDVLNNFLSFSCD